MCAQKIRLLAVSGSLRAGSSNNLLLQAIEKMIPDEVVFYVYKGIGGLPHFDDSPDQPLAVEEWRKALREADAVLICTPEYAFGVPGSLKNALDWTVSSGELVNKPLALITAATGGEKAHASFLQIFTALSANIPETCALLISFVRTKINTAGEINDATTLESIKKLIAVLVQVATNNTTATSNS